MARTAVLIHGMWGTSQVWDNWRGLLQARGWQTLAPSLRHHDVPPLQPPAALGTTSLEDYVDDVEGLIRPLPEPPVVIGHSMGGLIALKLAARGLARACVLLTPAPPSSVFALRPSNLLAFARIQATWGWWRKPHRATLAEALAGTFNTTDRAEATALHAAFVHESGRALFEIALPWLDRTRVAAVDPADVKAPLLFVAGEQDRLTPPGVVQTTARRFASDCRLYRGHGHWVLGQPGWQEIANDAAAWLEGARLMPVVDFPGLKTLLVRDGRLMALDVGSKTIGIATSDVLRSLATPLTTLKRGKLAVDLASLAELAKKYEIKALVVGLPLNMDGTEGPRCQSTRQFVTNIANHGLPALAALSVVFQDERMSTAAVTRGMIDDYDMSRAKRAERVDAAAAAWILESALARLR